MPKIFFEGRDYDNPEQMTPEARARYEKAAQMLPDRDNNGIPDLLEGDASAAAILPPIPKPGVSAGGPAIKLPESSDPVLGPGVSVPPADARGTAAAASKRLKWIIGLGIGISLFCAACFICFIVGIFASMKTSGGYQLAVNTAKGHPTAQQVLGVPIEDGLIVTGSVEENDASGFADLVIPVNGPNESGKLHAIAVKEENTWRLNSLVLEVGGQEYQLVP